MPLNEDERIVSTDSTNIFIWSKLRPTMRIIVKKMHPDAKLPMYSTDGSSAFDLFQLGDPVSHPQDPRALHYRTGLAFEVPEDHGLFILSRSGQGFNKAVRLSNCVGLIDHDYRGEVRVSLRADSGMLDTRPGDRIAQAVLLHTPRCSFVEVDELSSTERGTGGFGSTGD